MHKQVKSRLVPHLRALGFESTRTKAGKTAWPGEAEKGWGYVRRRDGFIDHLDIRWDKYGAPWFVIDFETAREGAPYRHESFRFGEVRTPRLPRVWRLIYPYGRWFGKAHPAAPAIDLAISGVDQLEDFLRTDLAGTQVALTTIGSQEVPPPPLAWPERILICVLWILVLPLSIPLFLPSFLASIVRRGWPKTAR